MKKNKNQLLYPFMVIFCAGLFMVLGSFFHNQPPSKDNKRVLVPTPSVIPQVSTSRTKNIFIPYWTKTTPQEYELFDEYYYFGIRPTRQGLIDHDEGFNNISITDSIPDKKKKLVLRMLDPSVTEVILEDKTAQKSLISGVGKLLQQSHFSGLVLDIEIPFTLQSNKQNQITQFVQEMCTDLKTDYKTCSMLIYGDFSFRKRPYDLKKLSLHVDKILLMAYDFHKAGGEPGPNFPFDSSSIISPSLRASPSNINYGYDFKQMISDATDLVPKEKIEVVFGMYGYDWTLNEQGTPLKTAKAMSLNEIETQISNDKFQMSKQSQIANSKEKNIEYVDAEGRKHSIWYEDEESVQIKSSFLHQQGISQISYWAHGYY